ncbi:MAG: hypothetical protein LBG76_01355 [Treponema sp.]|jgi:hypothetical protein|nr:hypothetical protein [Treponema sp.]
MDKTETERLIPRIRRARDFRLYTESGGRLVDLWQAGGTAILGHTPLGLLRELKNTASRGLFAPLPSYPEGRLLKALARLFPGREARLFPDEAALQSALASAGYTGGAFPDPVFASEGNAAPRAAPGEPALSRWRPFLDEPDTLLPGATAEPWFNGVPLLVPVLPLPWPGAPSVLIFDKSLASRFSPLGVFSPLSLAITARSIHDLIAAIPGRGIAAFPRLKKILARSGWHRRGIYLSRKEPLDGDAYTVLFRRFLDAGFLLPPTPRDPLILPAILSPGEEAKLASLLI